MQKKLNITNQIFNPQLLSILPEDVIQRFKVIPINLSQNNLELAMVFPNDLTAIDEIKNITGYQIITKEISEKDFNVFINKYFKLEEKTRNALIDISAEALKEIKDKPGKVIEEVERTEDHPIVKLMNQIVSGAITDKASDIHLEPEDSGMRVRYRIDGILHSIATIPKYLQSALISRAKIMSDMDVTERRRPQDGHASYFLDGKNYDLRVSSIKTTLGEKIVMRILDKSQMLLGLDNLGLSAEGQNILKSLSIKPYGMILVTGPTGSGKTTLLYSVLNMLNTEGINIITIEDPVEFNLAGVNQMQVNPQAGITFANGLRAILRQDPNIIMVGEIRDSETAEIAIRAALTGHLVVATLHTNDAPSAITRLLDMKIEPFLLASTIIGVIAQRLARKVCPECKGKACDYCYDTGMKGRTGLYEIMTITDGIRKLIVNNAPANEIKHQAVKEGMQTLEEAGKEKIKNGICLKEEIKRVVYSE